jgi:hypothetical protein
MVAISQKSFQSTIDNLFRLKGRGRLRLIYLVLVLTFFTPLNAEIENRKTDFGLFNRSTLPTIAHVIGEDGTQYVARGEMTFDRLSVFSRFLAPVGAATTNFILNAFAKRAVRPDELEVPGYIWFFFQQFILGIDYVSKFFSVAFRSGDLKELGLTHGFIELKYFSNRSLHSRLNDLMKGKKIRKAPLSHEAWHLDDLEKITPLALEIEIDYLGNISDAYLETHEGKGFYLEDLEFSCGWLLSLFS